MEKFYEKYGKVTFWAGVVEMLILLGYWLGVWVMARSNKQIEEHSETEM